LTWGLGLVVCREVSSLTGDLMVTCFIRVSTVIRCFNPPARSIASAARLIAVTSTDPGSRMAPVTETLNRRGLTRWMPMVLLTYLTERYSWVILFASVRVLLATGMAPTAVMISSPSGLTVVSMLSLPAPPI